MRTAKSQRGTGLVELMVASACGLVVSLGAMQFLFSSLRANSEYVLAAAAAQELRNANEYVLRELRRAGYDEDSMRYVAMADGNLSTSPFSPILVVRDDEDDSCVVFAYDGRTSRAGQGTGPGHIDAGAGEIRAIRRQVRAVNGELVGVIEVAETSAAVSSIDCDGAGPDYSAYPSTCNAATGWCALTDPRQLDISRFSVRDESVWNPPTASRNGSKVRELAITVEGGLAGHVEYAHATTNTVRVRAECLRPVAATATPDTTGTLCNTAPGA
jgi:Tfp pilus assembly protein PilW